MSDQSRMDFEKFRAERNAELLKEGHKEYSAYWISNTHYATWQASRASLCVTLPDKMGGDSLESISGGLANYKYDQAVDACREAITKTGVRVK